MNDWTLIGGATAIHVAMVVFLWRVLLQPNTSPGTVVSREDRLMAALLSLFTIVVLWQLGLVWAFR